MEYISVSILWLSITLLLLGHFSPGIFFLGAGIGVLVMNAVSSSSP